MDRARADRTLMRSDLVELGITPGQLRGPAWRSPFRGVRAPAAADLNDPALQRILDVSELVPAGGAIGGWAAGRLLGVPELDGRVTAAVPVPVLVVVPQRAKHLSPRAGVRYFRSDLASSDVTEVEGLPVTSALRTRFDLVRLSSRREALVAGDLMARLPGLTPDALLAYADEHRRYRGVPQVRLIGPLIDPLSRSPGESRLRYLWVVDAGLPVPLCNPYLLDGAGQVVAMPDLLDLETGMVGEYDGSTHRELQSHTDDNEREERFEALGLVVVRATSIDVGPRRARTVDRLLTGRERAARTKDAQQPWGWRPGRLWLPASVPRDLGGEW